MEDFKLLLSIAKILNSNESFFAHGTRVAKLACSIAKKMGYCNEGIESIRFAAIVHDIGKIEIPSEILNKQGILNKNELAMIRKHPESGYYMLKGIKPDSIIAEVVLQHHERLNGSGYPFGLYEKDINPVAKIIAIADVIDTMISPQVYRSALPIKEAVMEVNQNSGLLYDRKIVDITMLLIERNEFEFKESAK